MSVDKIGPSGEPLLHAELEWARVYRHQKKQIPRTSIIPTGSPLNIKALWEQFQRSKELSDIKELKRKLKVKPKLQKLNLKRIDPLSITNKKQYFDYMATPRKIIEPPKERPKKKKPLPKIPCSPRLLTLALPTKVAVLGTWINYQNSLPMDFITRLDGLLHTEFDLDPKFARCYFKNLDKKKRKQRLKQRRLIKKEKRKKRKNQNDNKEWVNTEVKITVDLIIKFLQKEPLFAVNFKQTMISDAILSNLKKRGDIKHKPARNTNKPYGHAIVDIVDQLSVWLDTVVNYVDALYTESTEEIVEVSSIELLGEEEEEGEDGMGIHRFPPLPLPELLGLSEITEEGGEGGSTYGTTTALETVLGQVAAGEGDDMLAGDTLALLIKILSNSSPEMLEELVNPAVLPDITYGDVLQRLKNLRDEVIAAEKKQRASVLEKAMVAWAKSNEPNNVNQTIIDKIQDTAALISECLMKEAKSTQVKKEAGEQLEAGDESGGLTTKEEPGGVEEPTDTGGIEAELKAEAEADVAAPEAGAGGETNVGAGGEADAAADAEAAGGAEPTDTETEEPISTDAGGESLSVDATKAETEIGEDDKLGTLAELGGGEEEITDLDMDGSAIGSFKVRQTDSKTGLLTEASEGSAKDQEFEDLDMTGELNVVMEETISPEESMNVLGMTLSQIMAKQEADKQRALEAGIPAQSSIPSMIPGHKPSRVFEHQPDTICCLTLKVWATWLLEVAHNAHQWSKWLNDIINEVRRIASIIRGEVKDTDGVPVVFYREDWIEFSEKVDNMITSWRQYSMHVKDLTDKIVNNFRGKTVTCCPKCMEDNLIVDVVLAHNISQQLAEAMNTAGYWRRWLDSVVMETKRLTGAVIDDGGETSSYGTMDIVELHPAQNTESEESLYEIEELDPNDYNL